MNGPSSPLYPQTPTPFLLSGCLAAFWVFTFLCRSCTYAILFVFLLLMSFVNLIIRPAKEPRKVEGKIFWPFIETHRIERHRLGSNAWYGTNQLFLGLISPLNIHFLTFKMKTISYSKNYSDDYTYECTQLSIVLNILNAW